MKKIGFYIILTLTLVLIPFGFSDVKAEDMELTRDYYNIDGCKKGNTVSQCKDTLSSLYTEVSTQLMQTSEKKIDYTHYPTELSSLSEECIVGKETISCLAEIRNMIDMVDGLNHVEFSCNYISQIDGGSLVIDKYPTAWFIFYHNEALDYFSTSNVGLGNILPTSDCEDVFYIINKNTIKAVDANSSYAGNSIAQICNGYGNEVEHFCYEGNCKITNPICGDEDTSGEDTEGTCPKELKPAIIFLKKVVFNTVQILVPIILILMGSIDLVKAVMAGDDKGGKDAVSKFIKRILAAVLVFFVTTIVSIVIGMIAQTDVGAKDDWKECWINID